jgi:hypothetical protein
MLIAIIIADLLMAGVFFYKFSSLPPQIPLFFSRAWGEDQLADIWFIFLLPVLAHLFIGLNILIGKKLFTEDKLVNQIISVSNYVVISTFTFVFLKLVIFIT